MIAIDTRQLASLEWRQPSALSRTYELKSGDSQLAELKFEKPLGTLATARTAAEEWSLKRSGFLNPVVTARVQGTEVDIASFRPKYTGRSGTVSVGGEDLTLRPMNFWGSEWSLEGANRNALIRIHKKGAVHFSATYEVSEEAKKRGDLGLLLCLSWYILVLLAGDE